MTTNNKITWKIIEDYLPLIRSLCCQKTTDYSLSVDDIVNECCIHIFQHKNKYDDKRGSVATFIRIKTKQQLYKIYSKSKTLNKNKKMYEHYLMTKIKESQNDRRFEE